MTLKDKVRRARIELDTLNDVLVAQRNTGAPNGLICHALARAIAVDTGQRLVSLLLSFQALRRGSLELVLPNPVQPPATNVWRLHRCTKIRVTWGGALYLHTDVSGDEGNERVNLWNGINYGFLLPVFTAAVQQLQTELLEWWDKA